MTIAVAGRANSKSDSLKGRESRGIQMFDHLDDRSGIEAGDAFIAIHERSLDQADAGALPLGKLIHP